MSDPFARHARAGLVDRLARRLPFGLRRVYLSLWLNVEDVSPGVERVVPKLALFIERDWTTCIPLFQLPGAKLVELWDARDEPWLGAA